MNFSISLLEIKDVEVWRVALVALRTSALVSWLCERQGSQYHSVS